MTYSPHVDQASAQEWVQAPVYAGQTGDVEDFMPHACREQEQEVQQPVPHLILGPATALQKTNTNEHKIWMASGTVPDQISSTNQPASHKLCWLHTSHVFYSFFALHSIIYTSQQVENQLGFFIQLINVAH